jgi:hypothetical protein
MKKKLLISILVIAIIIPTSLILYLNQPIQNPPVPLSYTGTLYTSKGYPGALIQAKVSSDGTLFNCIFNVSYTASNGTTIKITKELGTIDRGYKTP